MIRNDLIQEELYEHHKELTFKKLKPSNRFIDWIFRHYYVVEHLECFYDSEPDYDDEEYSMYLDYKYAAERKGKCHSEKEHTREELKAVYESIKKQQEEYKEHRLTFPNWIEVYAEGVWRLSQYWVDKDAREHLKNTKRCRASYNGRLFIAQKDDSIYLYYYGRDVEYLSLDYWWIFKKRKHPKVL